MGHGDGGGRPPYGWTATGGGAGAFAPVPAEIAVLKLIRDLRAEGATMPDIAELLNAAGHRTKKGRLWTRSKVFGSLHVINRFGIPDDIDAAISSAWEKANAKKGGDKRNPNSNAATKPTGVTRVARGA